MAIEDHNFPSGNSVPGDVVIHTAAELGAAVRQRRAQLQLKQSDLAGLGGTGNRFVVELERGKPTVQLQKALDIMALLGLEVVVRPKTGRGL